MEEVFFEMPRYYFHVKRGQVTVLDQEGLELSDITEAMQEAARRAAMIASKDTLQGISTSGRMIIIADDAWQKVMELPF
jgi:hypothetical protein